MESLGLKPKNSFWRGKNVIITGHTGFKGCWLAFWLTQLGTKVTGYALDPPTDPNLFSALEIQKNIIDQLEKPVLWSNTIIKMIQDGMTNFFELGPGMVLNGLNRRINKEMITQNFDKIEHLDAHAIL